MTIRQLIKKLSATPIIHAQEISRHGDEQLDSQASLQANKATFFFRLVRTNNLYSLIDHD
jgi:CDK inhibitor PHO81